METLILLIYFVYLCVPPWVLMWACVYHMCEGSLCFKIWRANCPTCLWQNCQLPALSSRSRNPFIPRHLTTSSIFFYWEWCAQLACVSCKKQPAIHFSFIFVYRWKSRTLCLGLTDETPMVRHPWVWVANGEKRMSHLVRHPCVWATNG